MRTRFDEGARSEFDAALDYYESREPGLGGEFLAEVEGTIATVLERPHIGVADIAGTRRIILQRFPYSLVYLVEPDGIVVIALAHHRREPGYWRERERAHARHDRAHIGAVAGG